MMMILDTFLHDCHCCGVYCIHIHHMISFVCFGLYVCLCICVFVLFCFDFVFKKAVSGGETRM